MRIIKLVIIFLALFPMTFPASVYAQCIDDEFCSRSTSPESCQEIGGRPVSSCNIQGEVNGTCCRPKRDDGGIDFDWMETQSTPYFLGGFTNLGSFTGIVLPYVFSIAGMLLLLYVIYGGYQLLLSQGDPQKAAQAKKNLTNAVFGFVIIIISYLIVQLFGELLGLEDVSSVFPGI